MIDFAYGTIALYLGKVQFLRVDSGEHRVGFGLGA